MNYELGNRDLTYLRSLYDKEINELRTKLLNGEAWENLKNERRNVTDLAIAIHRKKVAARAFNPAEYPSPEQENNKP